MFRKILFLFSGNVFTMISSFAISLIVVRMVSVDEYGKYATISGFMNMSVLPLAGLFSLALRRYIPYYMEREQYSKLKGLIDVSLKYALLLSILSTFLFIMLSDRISKLLGINDDFLIVLYATVIPTMVFANPIMAMLLGFERFKEYSIISSIVPNSLRIVYLLIWWMFLPAKLVGIITSISVKNLVTIVLSIFLLRKRLDAKFPAEYELWDWLKFSFPNVLRFAFSFASQNISVVLLGSLNSVSSAAVFKVSYLIVQGIHGITLAFSTVALASFSRKLGTYEEIKLVKDTSFRNVLTISVFLVFIVLFGKYVLSIFGSEYVMGYGIVLILSIILVLEALSTSWQVLIVSRGKTHFTLMIHIISSSISIVASYFLITYYGILGASMAMVSESFANVLFRYLFVRKLGAKDILDGRAFALSVLSVMVLIWLALKATS